MRDEKEYWLDNPPEPNLEPEIQMLISNEIYERRTKLIRGLKEITMSEETKWKVLELIFNIMEK